MTLKDKMNILPGVLKQLLTPGAASTGSDNLSSRLNHILNPAESQAPDEETVFDFADAIMRTADRHCSNGSLTVNELRTFLARTRFEGFLHWITEDRLRMFGRFDVDRDGALSEQELQEAVRAYLNYEHDDSRSSDTSRNAGPSPVMHTDPEKAQLLWLNRKLSHEFHQQSAEMAQMQHQLSQVPEILGAQQAKIQDAYKQRDAAQTELAYAQNEIEELRGMLERMKLAREYQMTAREVADRALQLASIIGDAEAQDRHNDR
eukprot:TRINITY_DN28015_c0_g2_i2.p1 TRINITY_DN28015_c0_g2~~TRINITY_DN28015_c0_g2_i2.p1  ORF type:complete len:262 (+),score=97.00 TRINITY_DN28015_c0_g2_i2:117-902(+)